MTQHRKELATKPDNLILTPQTHMIEEETQFPHGAVRSSLAHNDICAQRQTIFPITIWALSVSSKQGWATPSLIWASLVALLIVADLQSDGQSGEVTYKQVRKVGWLLFHQ